MIHELRTYRAAPGRMNDLQRRFRDHTCRLFERHGIRCVGFWTNHLGGRSDELIYMLEFDDLEARETAWNAFRNDAEWHRVRDESEMAGPLITFTRNVTLTPLDMGAAG